KREMAERIIEVCGDNVAGKTIAVLGLTFKPNTDDMRESPSLDIIPALVGKGAIVRAYDPEGMKEAQKVMPHITYCTDAYDAMEGADCVAILTEWNQFRALSFERMKKLVKRPVLVDLRNIYKP